MLIELIYIYFLKGDPGADGPAGEMGPPVSFILFSCFEGLVRQLYHKGLKIYQLIH